MGAYVNDFNRNLRDAVRRYLTMAERDRTIPIEDALPEGIEAMRRAEEEHAREGVRLEDLQPELGVTARSSRAARSAGNAHKRT